MFAFPIDVKPVDCLFRMRSEESLLRVERFDMGFGMVHWVRG